MPEVRNYQVYAGLAAPINFNGLVRQYYLRAGAELGDIQVNLVDKHERQRSEPCDRARGCARRSPRSARAHGAVVKVVEVPPGPPVLAPIVAEIYGPDDAGRLQVAQAVRTAFLREPGVVDVDASYIAAAPRQVLSVDRPKAALLGVSDADIVSTLRAGIAGEDATYLQDASKYPGAAAPAAARTARTAASMPR